MKANDFRIESFDNKTICIGGIGKMFYQHGFPISVSVSELKKKNIEVSFLHVINEFWNNGWSWKTIEAKLNGEMEVDIDKSLVLDMDYLKSFYDCLEQPKRKNGGYEESREMIYQYLFNEKSSEPKNSIGWFKSLQPY